MYVRRKNKAGRDASEENTNVANNSTRGALTSRLTYAPLGSLLPVGRVVRRLPRTKYSFAIRMVKVLDYNGAAETIFDRALTICFNRRPQIKEYPDIHYYSNQTPVLLGTRRNRETRGGTTTVTHDRGLHTQKAKHRSMVSIITRKQNHTVGAY